VRQLEEQAYIQSARSYFDLMVTFRQWNAEMGGVFVPVSDMIQPNPYLDPIGRDILLPDGRRLTKINPAFMTRLVATLSADQQKLIFHITSLKPIRPENAASDWEAAALTLFEQEGQTEYYRWDQRQNMFYYMAPLTTLESCLVCHEYQGYKVGDIRGGISVVFSTQTFSYQSIAISHLLILLVGYALIGVFGRRLSQAIDRLERQSQVDGLTGLNNRSYFDEILQKEFLRAKRQQEPLSIIMLDVDYFKPYNDTYGHLSGDSCLKRIAGAIKNSIHRSSDFAARYGGEEFALILPNTPLEGAMTVAERIRSRVEQLNIPHKANPSHQMVTISLGVWSCDRAYIDTKNMLEMADAALYIAKRAGRNTVRSVEGSD